MNKNNPNYRHGLHNKKSYKIYHEMIRRCHVESSQYFYRYGGRGIYVCKRWRKSFVNFYKDMGEKPKGKSLDRINNDGPYSLKNCRWATDKQQANNKRIPKNAIFIEFRGNFLSLKQWSIKTKIPYQTLHRRLFVYMLPVDRALTQKVK